MISANKIKTVRQRRLYNPLELAAIDTNGTILHATETATNEYQSVLAAVMAIHQVGVEWFHGMIGIPTEWDRDHDIRVRVICSGAQATAGTYTPEILYNTYEYNGTDVPLADATTALDTVVPGVTTVATANVLQATGWGIINGGTIPEDDALMQLKVTCALVTINEIDVYGLEFEYSPKWYKGRKGESSPWQNKN